MKRGPDLHTFYLKPGEMHFADEPTAVTTVLGSCLSITMFVPRTEVGAICHGLLPNCSGKNSCVGDCADGFRFVDCSIKRMVRIFEKLNVRKAEIEVKIFGGADMFDVGKTRKHLTVGRQNINSARQLVKSHGLKVAASDIGGVTGRKIIFLTHTGEVFLKRIRKSDFPIVSNERKAKRKPL